jgi:hypothetical protein
MDGTQEILIRFDNLEIVVVRATFLVSFVIFCLLHTWHNIRDLIIKPKQKSKRRRRR